MTRAREVLATAFEARGFDVVARGCRNGSVDTMLLAMLDGMEMLATERADAEAAAMRERAAGVADAHVAMGYMSGRERDYCHGHGDEIAELIRALPTTEVGNG